MIPLPPLPGHPMELGEILNKLEVTLLCRVVTECGRVMGGFLSQSVQTVGVWEGCRVGRVYLSCSPTNLFLKYFILAIISDPFFLKQHKMKYLL